jgi:membrane associated rhomboid family serine protease
MRDPGTPDDRPAWLREQQAGKPVTCYRHPDRPTGLRCSRCDRPICGECAHPAAVGQLCPDDARQRTPGAVLPGDRAPVVTYAILGLNAVMLVVVAVFSGGGLGVLSPAQDALCRLGALNSFAIAEQGQWWRLLTVMVLHGGILHFALNSYALFLFGPTLEQVLGHARYLALYVVSGLAGSAASFAIGDTALGVGASGAIFGLLGALVAYFFRRRDRGGSAPLQRLIIIVALNLVLALNIPQIDNLAHAGGFVGGLVAMALMDALPQRNRLAQTFALAVPALAAVALTAVGIATFDFSPPCDPGAILFR